ncbi:hypothetical protein C2857_007760 [Epichloe festucae Fl1]|uniref:Uncharacterized protein n=1 Tax=Epichloe festucae (strain Fl1) TaxID=877507 RepID=A0A7S9KMV2_EPIFF|nr:hypothetical protein C2857_007760 [Epichloe festucae Fl1]
MDLKARAVRRHLHREPKDLCFAATKATWRSPVCLQPPDRRQLSGTYPQRLVARSFRSSPTTERAFIMADTKSRPGRSNSLQRMLDLEKQYMTNQPNSKCQTTSAFGTNHQASPDCTSIHARRAEGAQKSQQSSGDHRRYTSLPPQLPPLMINTDKSYTMSRSDFLMDRGRELPTQNGPHSATATPNDKYKKVVAFEFPPKEVAQCQSPSWEAYERRKNEKKMEKKEREESKKDGIKRLSKKPPPPSSPRSLQQALAEADASRGRGRERAESTAAVGGLSKENKPARKARSRSGSFVSMLRAPFEFRRSYTDQGNDSGFIGGIKLELQRHAAQQQNLDSHVVGDESDIHPALRKDNQEPKSNTPLKSPPPPSRPASASETDQRRYPPITRGNNHHQNTAPLVSPSAPAIPDISTFGKWRTKVDLKAGSGPQSRAGRDEESQLSGDDSNGRKQQSNLPRAAKGPREQPKSPSTPSSKPVHIAFAASPSTHSPSSAQTEPKKQPENRRPQYHSNNESVSSNSSATTGYKTAPSSPPPPEPPRRSSKRLSGLSLDEAIPPVPPLTLHHQTIGAQLSANDEQSFAQRSFPLLKNTTKPQSTQPKDGRNEKATSSSCQMSPYLPLLGHNGHLPNSSSEDSCSEDFHSTSSVSTPATSRPGSERGIPLISKDEAATSDPNVSRARLDTTYPLQSADNSEDEGVDPIQAAAEKVLAVFNGIPVQRSNLCRRRNSYSSLATDTSFEPSARERPLNLRSRKKATEPSQNGYSPGSYLEEARTQPPAAAPTRVYKQRFGPPASFALPDQHSYENDNLKPAPEVPDTVGRPLCHKSTPRLATTDRDPIAKTFVECCSCKYYHDMPRNLYQAMSNPEGVLSSADKCGFVGALSMTVRCSWCKHEMSVRCCAALSTMVYIQERLY